MTVTPRGKLLGCHQGCLKSPRTVTATDTYRDSCPARLPLSKPWPATVLVHRLMTKGQAWVDRRAARFEQNRKALDLATLQARALAGGQRLVPFYPSLLHKSEPSALASLARKPLSPANHTGGDDQDHARSTPRLSIQHTKTLPQRIPPKD